MKVRNLTINVQGGRLDEMRYPSDEGVPTPLTPITPVIRYSLEEFVVGGNGGVIRRGGDAAYPNPEDDTVIPPWATPVVRNIHVLDIRELRELRKGLDAITSVVAKHEAAANAAVKRETTRG